MIELIEFKVRKISGDSISEFDWKHFVEEFLEPRALYWGGGDGDFVIQGVISVADVSGVEINDVIREFSEYFGSKFCVDIRLLIPEE